MSDFVIENGVLTKYTGSDKEVVIPEEVTEIAEGAFLDCTTMEHITVAVDQVKIIMGAFQGCTKLKRFTVPASVTNFSAGSLYIRHKNYDPHWNPPKAYDISTECPSLKEIELLCSEAVFDYMTFGEIKTPIFAPNLLPDQFPRNDGWFYDISRPLVVRGFAQRYCSKDELPETCKNNYLAYIKENKKTYLPTLLSKEYKDLLYVMLEEKLLTKKNIADLLEEANKTKGKKTAAKMLQAHIDETSLEKAKEKTEERRALGILTAAEAKKAWKYRKKPDGTIWIYQCKLHEKEDFPDGVLRIPSRIGNAVVSEYGLTEKNKILYPYFGSNFLGARDYVKQVELPDSLTVLGKNAFEDLQKLKEIRLPAGLKQIGEDAFCFSGIRKLTLPASLESIGERALYGIKSIEIEEGNPYFYTQDGCLCHRDGRLVQYFQAKKKATVPEGVEEILTVAFYGRDGLNITLPASVWKLHEDAFYNCDNLTVTILHDDAEIDEGSFRECANLTIRGWPKSTAQDYAEEHNIPFEAL